ncbi:hypothetical protein KQX54_002572 [Cotesia glomerata]|uniref:Uncharacterized protein n=1 Tax=Cotesia glomerata TaxID=32391 RepID=A0AAV7ILV1_COTGL|nr:hypothetical protein KQX54_002572 [Cotesia glomerata]
MTGSIEKYHQALLSLLSGFMCCMCTGMAKVGWQTTRRSDDPAVKYIQDLSNPHLRPNVIVTGLVADVTLLNAYCLLPSTGYGHQPNPLSTYFTIFPLFSSGFLVY